MWIHLRRTNIIQLETNFRRKIHRAPLPALCQPDPDTGNSMNHLIINIYPIRPLLSEPVTQQCLALRDDRVSPIPLST